MNMTRSGSAPTAEAFAQRQIHRTSQYSTGAHIPDYEADSGPSGRRRNVLVTTGSITCDGASHVPPLSASSVRCYVCSDVITTDISHLMRSSPALHELRAEHCQDWVHFYEEWIRLCRRHQQILTSLWAFVPESPH